MLQEAGGSTERRRSRTYRAVGCTTALVLKTNWATGPMPLRDERSARRHRSSGLDSLAMHGVIFTSFRGYLLAVLLRGLARVPRATTASTPRWKSGRACCGAIPRARSTSLSAPALRAPEHALVADSAGEAVRVEALQQELGRAARDAERVAKAGECDRRQRMERVAAPLVERFGDREAVTDPPELPSGLQEGGELAVLDTHQVFGGEPVLQLDCCGLVITQLRGGAGREGLPVAALDVEERRDRRGPRLRRQQLGERQAGVQGR